MSDFNSSLPVRTQTNGDVVAFLADGTTPTQLLAINASGQLALTSQGSASGGTAAGFSELVGGIYNSTPLILTNGQQSSLQLDSSGFLKVNLATSIPAGANVIGAVTQSGGPWTQNLTQVGGSAIALGQTTMSASIPVTIASNQTALSVTATNFPTTVDTNYGTVGASTIRTASQVGNATGAADFNSGATSAQTLRTSANQGSPNSAANAWPISITSGGTLNGPTNPLFVTLSDTVGTSVDNYNTASAIAASATSNHDYTVTAAKTFYSKQIWASASGKLKIEVQFETAAGSGTFNTFFVGFNSTSTPNILVPIPTSKTQVTGAKIRVIRTNEDKAAQDVYSTISGTEQ